MQEDDEPTEEVARGQSLARFDIAIGIPSALVLLAWWEQEGQAKYGEPGR